MDEPREKDVQLNVRIPRDLRKQAKIQAVKEGRPLSEVIRELLKEYAAREPSPQK